MGLSKSDQFTAEQNHLATMAKALAHPARIAILQYLMKKGTCVCGDIVDELPLSQSTISQHLKELKKAGIIQGNIEGTFTCYCLDSDCCSVLRTSFLKLFDGLKKCC
jgi:ArsR family transcriptional regulator, arsenate/arsenite/antimonite-responsive transcriptional repressor